jgi:hypothetical protein
MLEIIISYKNYYSFLIRKFRRGAGSDHGAGCGRGVECDHGAGCGLGAGNVRDLFRTLVCSLMLLIFLFLPFIYISNKKI